MNRPWLLPLLPLLALALPLAADGDPSEFVIDGFVLSTQPAGHYVSNFIENLAPDAIWLSEESNGFGFLDRPRVYFEGDSWTQFRWDYDGHDIASALEDGGLALQPPLAAIGAMALRGETPRQRGYGFSFVPRRPPPAGGSLRVTASGALPRMGGWTALGKLAVANHASLRDDNLYRTRRRLGNDLHFGLGYETRRGHSSLLLAAGFVQQQRLFNDFNERDSQFAEDNDLLQALGRWQRQGARGLLVLDLLVNAGRRGHLLAELGRYPQETYRQQRQSWLAGASWQGRPLDWRFSWLHERLDLRPAVLDAAKDLQDIDGQAFLPFDKWGVFTADTLAASAQRRLELPWGRRRLLLQPFVDARFAFLAAAEETGQVNPVHFAGQPYLVYLWSGAGRYRQQRLLASTGALLSLAWSRRLSLDARLFLQHQGFSFQDRAASLSFWQPGAELGMNFQLGARSRVSLSFGDLPYALAGSVGEFLETRRPGAEVRFWDDADGDGLYQEGEAGGLFALSGGASHAAAPDLAPTRRRRLALFFSAPLSRLFQLDVKGLIKQMRRPLWVRFTDEYGHYEEIAGKTLYVLDRPVGGYELGNAAFAQAPFYAQFLLRLHAQRPQRWYFSFSFLAHIGMGTTAFGNGPEANDIGVISESQAHPNAWRNGFGRVDGDRAFVGKIHFACHLAPRLVLGGSVKYRDGNPFAFLEALAAGNQWLLTYQTIKGEDERSRKGGPREDCIWDFNFQLSYDISLWGRKARLELSAFNLLDFGGELSENAFANDITRLANEMQIPRSLRLGVTLEL